MSDYSVKTTYSNDDFEWEEWTIDFDAEQTVIHEDMVRYYPDGTGYPGYDGTEDRNWTINSITDEDGNELELGDDNYPVNWTEEQKKGLEEALNNYLDDVEWNYPEPDWEED